MNEITMKMQADQLIRMALQEDITSEDVSTNAVMPTATKGTVELIAKEDGRSPARRTLTFIHAKKNADRMIMTIPFI